MIVYGFAALLLGLGALFLAARYLIISLGYRRGKTVRGRAYLTDTEHESHLNHHDRGGRFVHDITTAYYTYTVDGKKYTIEETVKNTKPQNYASTCRVVYQPGHPERAYLENLTLPREPFLCGAMAFLALVFLANAVMGFCA